MHRLRLSLTNAAVRRELVFDECGALTRAADKLTPILIGRLNKLLRKKENESAAKTGFALIRLQSPVFTAARFYRLFYFPLPPWVLPFTGGYCGTVPRARQRPQNYCTLTQVAAWPKPSTCRDFERPASLAAIFNAHDYIIAAIHSAEAQVCANCVVPREDATSLAP